jgi:hypothetical protein
MKVWLVHDTNPLGGNFSAWSFLPTPGRDLRDAEDEIRSTDVPQTVWDQAMNAQLPRDEDESNDSTWSTYWDAATVVWVRSSDETKVEVQRTLGL